MDLSVHGPHRYTVTMAAKKRAKAATAVVRYLPTPAPRSPAPVIRLQTPRAPAERKAKRKKGTRRRVAGGGASWQMLGATALGGAALGFIEKQWPSAPTIPYIGRPGTIALGAWFFGGRKSPGLMRDIAVAGAVVAGYELGKFGKIAGEIEGDLAPQVGVAAQV